MKPILFSMGPIHLYAFGFMIALGLLLSLSLMSWQSKKHSFLNDQIIMDLILVTVLSGFLGARLFYVVQHRADYAQNLLSVFAVWEGGLIFYGGFFGAILGVVVFLKYKKIPILETLDFLSPYVALTHAFGRLGCFLNGCCYGDICDLPWAVQFPHLPEPVHPTQLYEAFFLLGLFFFLFRRYQTKRFAGEVTALYYMFYAIGRFFIEFVRSDNPKWLFFTFNQWLSVAVVLALFFFYQKLKVKSKREFSR